MNIFLLYKTFGALTTGVVIAALATDITGSTHIDSLIQGGGPLAGIGILIAFLLRRDQDQSKQNVKREAGMVGRIEKLEKDHKDCLIDLIEKTHVAITDNTAVLRSLERVKSERHKD